LNYEGMSVERVMDWYDRSAPPFREGKKRKEFPDAFVFAMLEKYLDDHKEEPASQLSGRRAQRCGCDSATSLEDRMLLAR
jgi:hypothetical protein